MAVKEPPFSLKETAEVQSHHFVYCWQVKDESQIPLLKDLLLIKKFVDKEIVWKIIVVGGVEL